MFELQPIPEIIHAFKGKQIYSNYTSMVIIYLSNYPPHDSIELGKR